ASTPHTRAASGILPEAARRFSRQLPLGVTAVARSPRQTGTSGTWVALRIVVMTDNRRIRRFPMSRLSWTLIVPVLLLAGCHDDSVSPRDVNPPAAPRGVVSVTGDGTVYLSWLANTESDLAGYRVYEAPCATGSSCP